MRVIVGKKSLILSAIKIVRAGDFPIDNFFQKIICIALQVTEFISLHIESTDYLCRNFMFV